MKLFEGKKGLVLGVANDHSIAWSIAQFAMEEGAVCGFSHLPDKADDARQRNRHRVAQLTDKHPSAKFLVPMNVQNDDDIRAVMQKTKEEFGQIDFLLHSIAHASLEDLKRDTVETSRAGFLMAMEISAYSLLAVANAAKDILSPRASILTMTYFGGEKCVPGYNVMGICKAALDSVVKYLAYDLGPRGVRVNAVSAGPVRTLAGRGAGVDDMVPLYEQMSPMGRNVLPEEVGRSGGFLLSDLSDGITGEILHVDCGYNIMGSPGRMLDAYKGQPS
ncbi:MAG: enoyl-ACP reductase [Planctomycetia bacterium]|nr:enoyl-ACP reductase [Planctomycetia bacterium]